LLVQHASIPGWLQVVASTSTSAQTRKPPGKIATHFEPGHWASALQSPAPVGAPPAPLLLLLLALLVVELPAPPADAVDPLDPLLPPLPPVPVPVAAPPIPVVDPVALALPVASALPEPVGPTELPQPAHVSTVRVVQVKNRIPVSSGHRRADPPEIQGDRRCPARCEPFPADAGGVN
jgi:hypothetical protein